MKCKVREFHGTDLARKRFKLSGWYKVRGFKVRVRKSAEFSVSCKVRGYHGGS